MAEATGSPRARFERQPRQSAFFSALPAIGVGIIASDTWLAPWAGLVCGPIAGAGAYALVDGYDTLMWRHSHA